MAEPVGQTRFGFLYRTDSGRIDRATWWRGFISLLIPAVALTLVWIAIRPYAHRQLTPQSPLIDPAALAAYVYLLAYAFAVIFIAIAFYNLSAKRFRARGKPASLAGLLPLFALLDGAAHWIAPRSQGLVPGWAPVAIDLLLAAVAIYTVFELGLAGSGREDEGAG